jgi:TP901 family phage tail tape measure protein
MSKRVVEVELSAKITEYKQGMLEAANATRAVGTEGEKLAQTREAFNTIGRSGLAAGVLIAAGIGVAIAKYAEFDQAMSYVIATGDDAAENQDKLREAALAAGAATVFSATESANAIEELAKAGLDASDILSGGLTGSLNLAAAGGLGVAEAAGIAATTLNQFKLKGSDASHVADLLAAGAGKAMGDVRDMGQALNQAGLVANQFGLSVEETVGTLSAFASAGLLGSDAGTSFRTMLLRLANPTAEVKDLMKQLGIEAYDLGTGKFVGLANLAGQLQEKLGGLTQAQKDQTLAMIFGQDAIRGANILLDEGAAGIDEWTDKVNDQGYAAETAATRLDNLKGDIEKLTGALDTAFISMGEGANGPGRFFVQMLSGMVDGFSDLPDWGQQTVFWIAAVTAAVATGGGIFLLSIPKVAAYRAALVELGPAAQRASSLVGAAMKGLGTVAAIGTAIALLNQLEEQLNGTGVSVTELANTITKKDVGSALQKSLEGSGNWFANQSGVLRQAQEGFEDFGSALDQVSSSMDTRWSGAFSMFIDWIDLSVEPTDNYRDALEKLGETLASLPTEDASAALRRLREEHGLTDAQLTTLIDNSGAYKDSLIAAIDGDHKFADSQTLIAYALGETTSKTDGQASASERATRVSELQEAGLRDLKGAADEGTYSIDDLAAAIRGFSDTTLNTRDAQRQFEQAIDAVVEGVQQQRDAYEQTNGTLEGFTASLDIGTAAGRDNEAALDAITQAAKETAASIIEQTGSQDDASAAIQRGRDALIEQLAQFGITGAAADIYADNLGLIPGDVYTAVALTGVPDAEDALNSLARNRYANVYATVYEEGTVTQRGQVQYTNAAGGFYDYPQAFADGGFPSGIYAGGRPLYKFAERETGWETFISGKPSERDRNVGIWMETGRRLGVDGGAGGGAGGVMELGPKSLRALTRKIVNQIAIDQGSIGSASNAWNANQAWRGASR